MRIAKAIERKKQRALVRRLCYLGVGIIICLFFWFQYKIYTSSILRDSTLEKKNLALDEDNNNHLRGQVVNPSPFVSTKESLLKDHDAMEDGNPTTTSHPHLRGEENDVFGKEKAFQRERRLAVKKAMQFAWENYEEHAFGGDEVDPINGKNVPNAWGGIACSMVDGIDTLWIMGMKDEFYRARDYIDKNLRFDHLGADDSKISVFETIIRELGGLLSAYDLSKDPVFKRKALQLMDLLEPAYDQKKGIFYTLFNPKTKARTMAQWAGFRAHIADVGTLQLEMRYLSVITGDPKYKQMGDAFYKIVEKLGSFKNTGLYPVHYDQDRGDFSTSSSMITLGALGDSFYEYLLKVWIFSGQKNPDDAYLRRLYDEAIEGVEKYLVYDSIGDEMTFLQELRVPSLAEVHRMDHLLCFVPGLIALGTLYEPKDSIKNIKHLRLAKKLMHTCYQLYHLQPTGLSPDIVTFPGLKVSDPKYRLRPETIESLFYLWRVTKDPIYRDMGYEIFQNIEKHCRTEHGYAAVMDVTHLPVRTENKMESFFLAETLKYHYLLQSPEDLIPLDKYVFNTEAHPLSIQV